MTVLQNSCARLNANFQNTINFLSFDDSKESCSNSNKNQLICLKCSFQNSIYKFNFSAISKSIFKCNTIFCSWQNLLLKAGVNSFTGHPVGWIWWKILTFDKITKTYFCLYFGSWVTDHFFSAGRIFWGKVGHMVKPFRNIKLYVIQIHPCIRFFRGCSQMTSAFFDYTPWCLCQPILTFCLLLGVSNWHCRVMNTQSTIHLPQKGFSWA